MTNLDTKLDGKRNAVIGTLNQAKGVAREKLGQATNNPQLRMSGKKDQVIGALQKNVGNSWAYRHKTLLTTITVVAAVAAAVFYFVNRSNMMSEVTNQYEPYQAH